MAKLQTELVKIECCDEDIKCEAVVLPKRQKPRRSVEPKNRCYQLVPQAF